MVLHYTVNCITRDKTQALRRNLAVEHAKKMKVAFRQGEKPAYIIQYNYGVA